MANLVNRPIKMPWMRPKDVPVNVRCLCYGVLDDFTGLFFAKKVENGHGSIVWNIEARFGPLEGVPFEKVLKAVPEDWIKA